MGRARDSEQSVVPVAVTQVAEAVLRSVLGRVWARIRPPRHWIVACFKGHHGKPGVSTST
ncbi:MAG: hypothetical protein ACRBN8_41085 [Nannocystales bacterium]